MLLQQPRYRANAAQLMIAAKLSCHHPALACAPWKFDAWCTAALLHWDLAQSSRWTRKNFHQWFVWHQSGVLSHWSGSGFALQLRCPTIQTRWLYHTKPLKLLLASGLWETQQLDRYTCQHCRPQGKRSFYTTYYETLLYNTGTWVCTNSPNHELWGLLVPGAKVACLYAALDMSCQMPCAAPLCYSALS